MEWTLDLVREWVGPPTFVPLWHRRVTQAATIVDGRVCSWVGIDLFPLVASRVHLPVP